MGKMNLECNGNTSLTRAYLSSVRCFGRGNDLMTDFFVSPYLVGSLHILVRFVIGARGFWHHAIKFVLPEFNEPWVPRIVERVQRKIMVVEFVDVWRVNSYR